ncbi:MAG: hypothetical protein JXL80_17545 [Planctomycetes bacterium]|nr:hypothetical protein [Planctomycetota bacterium]
MSDKSRLIALCDAVVAALNDAQPEPPAESPFVLTFEAERKVIPLTDLGKIGDSLLLHVIPVGLMEVREPPGNLAGIFAGQYELDVVVQKRLPASDSDGNTTVPDLLLLLEQIADHFKAGQLTIGSHRAVLTTVDAEAAYSVPCLMQKRCFLGVTTLGFKVL